VDIMTQKQTPAQSIVFAEKEEVKVVTPCALLLQFVAEDIWGIHYQQSQHVTSLYSSSLSGG
jgi:hypothetical protein